VLAIVNCSPLFVSPLRCKTYNWTFSVGELSHNLPTDSFMMKLYCVGQLLIICAITVHPEYVHNCLQTTVGDACVVRFMCHVEMIAVRLCQQVVPSC